MTCSELATAQIHKLPVKCLIINNNFLGMIRQWQEMFYDNRLSGADLEGNPDFVKLAQAYGVKAWRIRRPADVDRILAQAHAYDAGPCVVVAEVVKEDNVFPMIPAGAAVSRDADREAQASAREADRKHLRREPHERSAAAIAPPPPPSTRSRCS